MANLIGSIFKSKLTIKSGRGYDIETMTATSTNAMECLLCGGGDGGSGSRSNRRRRCRRRREGMCLIKY